MRVVELILEANRKPMKSILRLTILLASILVAAEPSQADSFVAAPVQSVSPHEIVSLVTRGRTLSEGVDMRPIWLKLSIEPGQFESCGSDCLAEISRSSLDDKPGQEVILKLSKSYNSCRFVVFSSSGKEWTFLGHIDHDFNRYQMARHRVAHFNGTSWLVIRGQEGSGSGFSLYGETWYQVGQNGLLPVVSYPVEGHTWPWPNGLGREFKAQVIPDRGQKKAEPDLVIRYRVTYTKMDYQTKGSSTFFVNLHYAHFAWNSRSHTFDFAAARSSISEAEIDAIANIESEPDEEVARVGNSNFYTADQTKAFVGGGYEVFLKYNFAELMKIARDRRNQHRAFLGTFLNECYDTAEKKELMRLLEKE
jgi:hypothetical protein